jgi:hypothetical protein
VGRAVAPLSRPAVAAAALALAGVAAAVAVLQSGGDDPPAGERGSGVRISYEVLDPSTGARTQEVVEVQPPFSSRRLLSGGGGTATTESGVYDRVGGAWRQLAVVPPGEPGQALQPAAALGWAEREGLARRDGSGTVAGRTCDWWLTREPLDSAVVAAPTAADSARSCVDASGLLLADAWTVAGREVRRRTATGVEQAGATPVLDEQAPAPVDPRLLTTVVERLSQPEPDLVDLAPLPGSQVLAAVRVIEVVPGTTDVVRRVQRTVLRRGDVLVVVDQVRPVGAAPLPIGDRPVALGSLGQGRVRATGAGLVLEVRVGEGLLRVRAGIPYDELVAWVSVLRRAGSP